MKAFDGHYWRDADGRPWSIDSVSDYCAICDHTPDVHPYEEFHDAGLVMPVVLALAALGVFVIAAIIVYIVVRSR